MRCADDILVFATSLRQAKKHQEIAIQILEEDLGLTVNRTKTHTSQPWEECGTASREPESHSSGMDSIFPASQLQKVPSGSHGMDPQKTTDEEDGENWLFRPQQTQTPWKIRKAIQKEINELLDEIDRIAESTEFNATQVLDGTFSGVFRIGANKDQNMEISITSMKTADLGVTGTALGDLKVENVDDEATTTGGVLTNDGANTAISVIDEAIKQVSHQRSSLGAIQNRLEHAIANLGTSAENLQAAESRIRDLDMEEKFMEFVKNSIVTQAATSMLAQANMAPQSVLQLLGG